MLSLEYNFLVLGVINGDFIGEAIGEMKICDMGTLRFCFNGLVGANPCILGAVYTTLPPK